LGCSVSDHHGATPVTLQQEGRANKTPEGPNPTPTGGQEAVRRGKRAEKRGRNETVKSNTSGLFVSYRCHHMDKTPTLFKAREQLTCVIRF